MEISVCILGATSLVGQRFVQVVNDHHQFEIATLTAMTADEQTGADYATAVDWCLVDDIPEPVGEMTLRRPDCLDVASDVDLVFSALPLPNARRIELEFADRGCAVCSTVMNERLSEDVPLLIPEINANHVELLSSQREQRNWDGALVKSPAPSVVALSIPLSALAPYGLTDVHVATLNGVSTLSGHDESAMAMLNNVSPHVESEASKLSSETKKLLGTISGDHINHHDLEITPSCNRVPVQESILENIWVQLADTPDPVTVESLFRDAPTSTLPSAPTNLMQVFVESDRPQSRLDMPADNGQRLGVGPISPADGGIQFDCLIHSTLRGAAGASLLNAELLVERGYV